jgi:hypothetical protein
MVESTIGGFRDEIRALQRLPFIDNILEVDDDSSVQTAFY